MNATEAADLCARAKGGDRDAADLLVRSVQPWCWKVAKQLAQSHPPNEAEDLAQVGMISVLRAIRYYDPTRASWVTYACAAVSQNVYRHAVRESEKARRLTVEVVDPDHIDRSQTEETPRERLLDLLDRLDPVARSVVWSAWRVDVRRGEKSTWKDCAKQLGLTYEQYKDILAAAEVRLKAMAVYT
jgi:RNA polymerase sigma factor (sigma-70 family)